MLGGWAAGSRAALDGIAFVAQDTPVYKNLSAADMVHLTATLNRRFDKPYARARLAELSIPLDRKAGKLSGGQRARLALTVALGRRPKLLILDEPVSMLDPIARHDFMANVMTAAAADGVYPWLTGLHMHHAEATYCHPASSIACSINFTGKYGETAILVSIALQAVPALIGAFTGAPVLGRELETGTYRYAWTQGIGRLRWTVGKLVALAVAVTAAAGAFTVLVSWYNQPFAAAGYAIPFSARVFDLLGVAFAAWALAAFAIGVRRRAT